MVAWEWASFQVLDMVCKAGGFKAMQAGGKLLFFEVELGADGIALGHEFTVAIVNLAVAVDLGFERLIDELLDGFHKGEVGIAGSM
jgi:hypothetical protein